MNNKITEYVQLDSLTKLTKLIQLDLSECPIATKTDYREQVFKMFPNLEILDNRDANNQSVDYEDEGDDEMPELGEEEEDFEDDGDEEDYNDEDEEDESDDGGRKPAKKLKK